jgi:S1-C subfamily serine protease
MNRDGAGGGRTRRAVLAALGGASVALAGCASEGPESDGGGQDGTEGGTDGGSRTATPAPEPFVEVYDAIVDSVVEIRGYDEDGRTGQGSGFVAFDGTVVTNQHVVAGAEALVVGYTDGSTADGELLGADVYSDLAAIRPADRSEVARPLPFVDAEPPVGTEVLAVGAPFGLGESASAGIVSGVDRPLPSQTGFSVADTVQTDAAANPGNSGGPLVTLGGEVAGVISAGGGDNIAFGISAALTQRVVPALVEDGEYDHAYVGVGLNEVSPPLARANDFDRSTGVYVNAILDGGPAEGVLRGSDGETLSLGVRVPTGGDLIVGLDGQAVESLGDLSTYLALNTQPGDLLPVSIVRDGERREVSLRLAERPEPDV